MMEAVCFTSHTVPVAQEIDQLPVAQICVSCFILCGLVQFIDWKITGGIVDLLL